MSNRSASPVLALGAILAALPQEGAVAPEWITVFPKLGAVVCRDGRTYRAEADALLAAFAADAIDLPADVCHATDLAAPRGERADAVGWIKELKVEGAALMARVEWTDEGAQLIASKKYRYTSPSFWHDKSGRVLRLKAVSLINAPALADQPALASAQTTQEQSMKTIATALGLAEDANEASCLAAVTALNAKIGATVPKDVHDAALAQLSAATTKLAEIETVGRKAKVDALLEGALKDKKILPAEREHYASLCATDEGLASVQKLFEARVAVLAGSGLDTRKLPEAGGQSAAQLAASAGKLVADARARGEDLSIADAMTQVQSAQGA